MTPEQLFLSQLKLVKEVTDFVCRRHHCSHEEAEEFASAVRLKLIDDDYAVFRKFCGKCRLRTYLTAVVNRFFLDWRNHLWGKWRACAVAKRLGPTAIKLDELIHRDGHTFDEACEILRTNHKVGLSVQQLADMAALLPARAPRPPIQGEEGPEQPARERQPDERMLDREALARQERALAALGRALAALPAQDRLIVKMWTQDGFSYADIARALGIEQKSIYRRFEGILKALRRALEGDGIGPDDIAEILRLGGSDVESEAQ